MSQKTLGTFLSTASKSTHMHTGANRDEGSKPGHRSTTHKVHGHRHSSSV
ncbi:unnamed protein product [Musa textilis]